MCKSMWYTKTIRPAQCYSRVPTQSVRWPLLQTITSSTMSQGLTMVLHDNQWVKVLTWTVTGMLRWCSKSLLSISFILLIKFLGCSAGCCKSTSTISGTAASNPLRVSKSWGGRRQSNGAHTGDTWHQDLGQDNWIIQIPPFVYLNLSTFNTILLIFWLGHCKHLCKIKIANLAQGSPLAHGSHQSMLIQHHMKDETEYWFNHLKYIVYQLPAQPWVNLKRPVVMPKGVIQPVLGLWPLSHNLCMDSTNQGLIWGCMDIEFPEPQSGLGMSSSVSLWLFAKISQSGPLWLFFSHSILNTNF